ncbi:MAG: 4-hydroxy-3-methylbut-2-enyl diphosphate reductase [Candidatus Aminicenantes bacterium]|nr:4-hydroxy-3-methylbut-2-enyl diphosphate reductase [Candidatus Aminicenantes bacterium]
MKISVAEQAGFCFGVKRALKLIDEFQRRGKQIQTFGPLIHNIPVLNELQARGIATVSSLRAMDAHKTLCIRTHGVPRDIERRLRRRGVSTLDATCPLVKKGQRIVEQLGRGGGRVLIVGDRDHPEIVAARSYARHVKIINSLDEARALPRSREMSVVAQTTLNTDFFKEVAAVLMEKTERLHVFNTICQATQDRQEAVRKLAPKVDAVIVVGSRISSNTKKLLQIAREKNRNVLQIETCDDLRGKRIQARLKGFRSVGLSAGASTSPRELENVKRFLQKL